MVKRRMVKRRMLRVIVRDDAHHRRVIVGLSAHHRRETTRAPARWRKVRRLAEAASGSAGGAARTTRHPMDRSTHEALGEAEPADAPDPGSSEPSPLSHREIRSIIAGIIV